MGNSRRHARELGAKGVFGQQGHAGLLAASDAVVDASIAVFRDGDNRSLHAGGNRFDAAHSRADYWQKSSGAGHPGARADVPRDISAPASTPVIRHSSAVPGDCEMPRFLVGHLGGLPSTVAVAVPKRRRSSVQIVLQTENLRALRGAARSACSDERRRSATPSGLSAFSREEDPGFDIQDVPDHAQPKRQIVRIRRGQVFE